MLKKKYVDNYEQESRAGGFLGELKKAKLIRLMQCVTNPNLLNKPLNEYVDSEDFSNIDDTDIIRLIEFYKLGQEVPPKFVKILELLKMITANTGAGGRAVVWAIFIQNIRDLREYLNNEGIECELLYGETPNENDDTPDDVLTREKIIRAFHKEDCPYKVIIANPFAVGESISLHKTCHNAIYLEKNFNAAMYMQSKDRIHRYGLSKDDVVNYYYLLSENSVDQVIHDRVLEKEQRMMEIIESREIPLLDLDMEDSSDDDIEAIIRNYHVRKNSTTQ